MDGAGIPPTDLRHAAHLEVIQGITVQVAGQRGRRPVWIVPGFMDSSLSWRALLGSRLSEEYEVLVPDLPGRGMTPPRAGDAGIDADAAVLATLIHARSVGTQVVLVGHSLGATSAVRAARRLEGHVAGLASVEGNLTTEDGYFSATAADFGSPEDFVTSFVPRVRDLVASRRAPSSYLASVVAADAHTAWLLGNDAATAGQGDAFGAEYRSVAIPKQYFWSSRSTPVTTHRYLESHGLDNVRDDTAGHWPHVDAPDRFAAALEDFIATATRQL